MPAESVIGFMIQLDDQLSRPLAKIEKGYTRAAAAVDKMNQALQKRSNKTADSLKQMTDQLEKLPSRMTKAANDLRRAMDKITPSRRGGGRGGRGGGSSDDIVKSVTKAVEKALKRFSITLKPSAPKVPNEMFATKDYRRKWEKMPPPPDYSGSFQKFQKGGEVQGSGGVDNVPAMLTPGEVVLPVGVVETLKKILGLSSTDLGKQEGGLVGKAAGAAAFGVSPVAKLKEAAYVEERRGGFIFRTALDEFKNLGGKVGTLIGSMDAVLKLEDSVMALKDTLVSIPKKISSAIMSVKERLGIDPEKSLLPGMAKVGIAAATIAAITVEDEWVALENQVNLTSAQFKQAQKIAYSAMIQYGTAADFMFGIMQKGMVEQKRTGKDLEEFTNIVAQFALDNEALADSTGNLIFEMNRYGIETKRSENILSGMIFVSRETTMTLDEMAAGITQVGTGLRQLRMEGVASKQIEATINSLNASVGVMVDQWGSAETAYSVFNAVLDPQKVNEVSGLLAFMADSAGGTTRQMRALMKTDPAAFWSQFATSIQKVDISRTGVLESLMARFGDVGIDKQFIKDIHAAGDFTDRMLQLSAATQKAAAEGKLVQERFAKFASTISGMWNKVKNSFYAFFIQIGDIFLMVIKPFIFVFVKGLQMIALALGTLGTPGKILVALLMTLVASWTALTTAIMLGAAVIQAIKAFKFLSTSSMDLVRSTWVYIAAKYASIKADILGTAVGMKLAAMYSFLAVKTKAAALATYGFATGLPFVGKGVKAVGSAFSATAGFVKRFAAAEGIAAKASVVAGAATKFTAAAMWSYVKATFASIGASIRNAVAYVYNAVSVLLLGKGISAATAAQWGLNAAMLANPVGIIAAAVVALTALMVALSLSTNKYVSMLGVLVAFFNPLGIMLYGLFDIFRTGGFEISNFFFRAGEGFKSIESWLRGGGEMGEFFADIFGYLKVAAYWVSGFFNAVYEQSDRFWSLMGPLWEGLKLQFDAVFGMLRKSLAWLFGAFGKTGDATRDLSADFAWVGTALEGLSYVVGAVIVSIAKAAMVVVRLVTALAYVVGFIADIFMGIVSTIWGIGSGITSAVTAPFLIAWQIISGLFSGKSFGRIFSEILALMKSVQKKIWEAVTYPFTAAWDYLFGNSIWTGDEIFKQFLEVVKGLKKIAKYIWDALTAPFKYAFDTVAATAEGAFRGIVSWIDEMVIMPLSLVLGEWGRAMVSSEVIPVVALGQAIVDVGNKLSTVIPAMAEGGIVLEPTLGLVGEAGPEAVVPLDRLPQIIQGETPPIEATPEDRQMVKLLGEIKLLLSNRSRRGATIDPLARQLVREFKVV